MIETELFELLEKVKREEISTEKALGILQNAPFRMTRLPFADLDHHRSLRQGIGEVIYGESKKAEEIISIIEHLSHDGQTVLVTRLDNEKADAIGAKFPEGRANKAARTFIVEAKPVKNSSTGEPFVAVLTAGTGDAYAAEEACEVCVAMDTAFEKFY